MSGPSWLQTTETPLKPDEIHKTGGDWLKGYWGSCQNWIASWIIKSQNGRKRPVKTSLPAFPHPPRPFSSGGRCHARQGPDSWFLHLYTQGGEAAFLSKVLRQDSGPIWVTCPLVDQSRWAEERTVVIGSHWFTVLPLTNRVTGKSKILRKDGLFPSDHRAEAMGRGRQKCLTSQEEFPADKLTVPRTHNLVGERNKQGCI